MTQLNYESGAKYRTNREAFSDARFSIEERRFPVDGNSPLSSNSTQPNRRHPTGGTNEKPRPVAKTERGLELG
jgi:hypothetical protein